MAFRVTYYAGLQTFFVGRSHQTKVGLCLSDVVTLLSGVIHGSGIGPVMFLIYTDDLAKLLERHGVTVKLFADNVKVYIEIDEPSDGVYLQQALDIIASWADEWQLPVSVSKCSILTVGRVYDRTRYHLNGTELPQSDICRDLGVTITSNLSPSQHISEIALKAHQRANHII